jgi:hypothetical protein
MPRLENLEGNKNTYWTRSYRSIVVHTWSPNSNTLTCSNTQITYGMIHPCVHSYESFVSSKTVGCRAETLVPFVVTSHGDVGSIQRFESCWQKVGSLCSYRREVSKFVADFVKNGPSSSFDICASSQYQSQCGTNSTAWAICAARQSSRPTNLAT